MTASAEISVSPRPATLRLTLPARLAVGEALTIAVSVDSGAAVELRSTTPSICTLNAGRLAALALGVCRIEGAAAPIGAYAGASQTAEITVGPAGAIELAAGAERVRVRAIPVSLLAPSWATAATIRWGTARPVALPLSATSLTLPSGDGVKIATVTFTGGGKSLSVTDRLMLDTAGPKISVVLARLAAGQANLKVTLSDPSGVDGFRVSIGGTGAPGAWLSSGSSLTLTGARRAAIYIQGRDALGNLVWKRIGVLPSR